MDQSLASVQAAVQLIAVMLLVSLLPTQTNEIRRQSNSSFRGVAIIMLLGNICMILLVALPLIRVLVSYNSSILPAFDSLANTIHALLAITMGILGKILYSDDSRSAVEDIDNSHKN